MEKYLFRYYAVQWISRKARELEGRHLEILLQDHYRIAYQSLPLPLAQIPGSTYSSDSTAGHWTLLLLGVSMSSLKVVNGQNSLDVELCHHLVFNPVLRAYHLIL